MLRIEGVSKTALASQALYRTSREQQNGAHPPPPHRGPRRWTP
jgi:hypothetical protein